ncbi:xirp2 [Pungitius sinensis]
MEIQSENGEEVARAVSAPSGFASRRPSGPRVETPDEPVLREDLRAAKGIERFDIPLDNLKRMFEKPAVVNMEGTAVHASSSKRVRSGSLAHTNPSTGRTMAALCGEGRSAPGHPEDRAPSAEDQEGEPVSVKERLAMYQAAVSKKESASSSAAVMSESEARSLPGGLASVKKQFESQEFASSTSQSTVAQIHFEQRSVQETSSSSEVTVRSSTREVVPTTSLFHNQHEVIHDERVHQNNVAASYGDHYNETVMLIGGEDLPKVSTQSLKQQYEKTIEEAAPAKEIKVDVDFNQFQWAPVNQSSKASAMTSYDTVKTATRTASSMASASSFAYEQTEHFPPPPSNLLQDTPDYVYPQPQEPASHKHTITKEQYFKHKSTAELKRLYKHINPEVRKNLEEDFLSELTEAEKKDLESEEMVGDVQQACYLFENDGNGSSKCSSPDREYMEWDEILKGEVQSMRWMFENKPLDTIKDDNPEEDEVGNIAQQEIIAGKDVRHTAWMFETRPIDALGTEAIDATEQSQKSTDLARGDVRTATWLFETQPLDYLNKIYQEDEQEIDVVINKSITGGDVKTARYLFETQHLDSLGKTETIEESNFLNLKSELEEVKGDVKTTTRMFETQPMCVIRGDSGEMLEITTIRREETEKGDVKTSRWMFETQPLDIINKDPAMVKLICGISMEDNIQVGVNKGRWLFETKTLDTIKDEEWESSRKQKEDIIGTDVRKHCLVFETQAMDTLKDNANARPLPSEEIVGGDVQTAKHLFETVPMENLKELLEVGKLKKMVASEEEKGDVRHQKWVFESQPLENIREEKKEITRTVNLEALDKIDVTNYKERFESMDLGKCEGTQKIQVEGVTSGSVRSNRVLFESTPMYAMQDSSGHYHEVRTVRREEIVKGDVRSCRWMFETRPIDEFDESINKFQIIKGISKQEVESGDVKTAKWLFETQALDSIKCFSQREDEEHTCKEGIEIEKGDVKTCRWLFETQPMDALYEKVEKSEDVEEVQKGDVKTCTWLFETQTLDNIRDHTETETILKTCTVKQDDVQGKDVRLARFLFETENLENLTGEDVSSFRRVTEIDIQSGDVSRMKYIFENRSSDIMSSSSGETMQRLKTQQVEEIQKGDVVNCTYMFEHHPIDNIRDESADAKESRTVTDVKGGDVDKGRFIFETYSLDEIKEESTETDISKITSIFRDEVERGDVKNYTMMFETQPLYAICDKEGRYHEVTTVTKEEIIRGDVVGARWQFETKPLDSIRDSEEVYVIKAVTEEGINKGDVNTARWRFETQPLDEITEEGKVTLKTVADIQGGDVKTNKQRFETDEMSQRYIKTVSVSEIQKGDVRSATWMFETRTIDEIRGEGAEFDGMERVTKEEVMKGDVKQSVWLFEKQPLDTIKETDGTELLVSKEQIPQADVKSTTWLFETTPFNEFNESGMKRTEIMGKSIKDTLEELYSQKMVESQGVLIEADEIGDVRMAKYNLMNQKAPQIQREETIRGDLSNIMMNLLSRREITERGITIDSEERGNINTTVKQLFNQERGINVEKEEIVRGDIQEAVNNLLKSEGSSKRGILIQEDEKGDVKLTIYSLLNKGKRASMEKEDIVQGNVSRTLHRLLSNSGGEDSRKIRVGDKERGNVSFYSTCIESGALDYLKQLQYEPGEAQEELRKENIIGGDIQETKILLRKSQQEIGRTVAKHEIVPGDVHSNVKVFMTEPAVTYRNLEKRDIVKGDLHAALDSLTQAMNTKVLIEKEEVVKGDIPTTLKSLEEAQHQAKDMEKPEIIRGDIKGALESLEKSATTNTEVTVEDLVPGDIKGTLKSLEEAKKVVKEIEKEEILKGDIHIAMQSLHEATSEKKTYQHQVSEQGDVRGTIQLLLEPTSPRLQRRGSIEGDVKSSIKCLYEGQEATQVEKEEVIKGDVRGAIKNLMQRKQYSNLKRTHPAKKVKVPVKNPLSAKPAEHECLQKAESEREGADRAPAVKKLSQSAESQKHTEKHNESKSVKTEVITQEAHSVAVAKTDNTTGASQQMSTKEQKQQVLPPQKTHVPRPILVKDKQMTINEPAEMNVMKEVQNITQTNISNEQVCQTKSIKQVHATVTEKTVVRKQIASEQVSQGQVENRALLQKHNAKNTETTVVRKQTASEQVSQGQVENRALLQKHNAKNTETTAVRKQTASEQVSQGQVENRALLQKHNAKNTETTVVRKQTASEQVSQGQVENRALLQKHNAKNTETTAVHKQTASEQVSQGQVENRALLQKHNAKNTETTVVRKQTASEQVSQGQVENRALLQKHNAKNTETTAVRKQTASEQVSLGQVENRALLQKHNAKNVNSDHRNLATRGKGGIKEAKPEIHFPPPPSSPPPPCESELSLPPPPSPVPEGLAHPPSVMRQDSDLPPPPPPPPMECKSEPEFFPLPPPPPPPPSVGSQDFLPPPPSQQELHAMPPPAKLGKPIGKPLFKVPNQLETQKQPVQIKPKWQKKQPTPPPPPPPTQPPPDRAEMSMEQKEGAAFQTVERIETSKQVQSELTVSTTKIPSIPAVKPLQKESPKPPKKSFVPPIKLPPPLEPAPAAKPKTYARKFKTPLMLAEERYRQQMETEEIARTNVTTPTSPPIKRPSSAAGPEPLAARSIETEEAKDASKAKCEEAKAVSTEGIMTAKNTDSQIPLSKPLISVLNKKLQSGSSNVPVDKRMVASQHTEKMASNESQAAHKQQTVSTSQASNIKNQSCSNVVTSSVTEQQQFIKKSSTRCVTAVQENVDLQSHTAVTLKAEDVKNSSAPLTQVAKMSSFQSTKIPKSTQSFKVKTFKMPTETKEEKCDMHSQREESSASQVSETKGIQRSHHLTSARTEMKTEKTVKEKKSHVTPPIKECEQDVHIKKEEQVQGHMADVKLSPPVTLSMPKEGKMTSAPGHHSHVSVSRSQQSVRTEHIQRHEEVVLTESVVQQHSQRREAVHVREKTQVQEVEAQIAEAKAPLMTAARSKGEQGCAPVRGTHKTAHRDESHSKKISDLEKCHMMQSLLAELKELEGTPSKMDSNAVRMMISKLPDWAMGADEKRNFGEIAQQQSKKKLKEMLVYVRNICHAKVSLLEESVKAAEKLVQERDATPPKPDEGSLALARTKVSKISIGSSRSEKTRVEEKKSLHERQVHQEPWEASERRVSSPLASIRTPSPTFISIESRRIDSQSRVTPSPPPFKAVGTPPPPPRRSHTPTTTFRATPSPTLCRSEKLTKLKDTTSKLSHGMTPPPPAPAPECIFVEREQCSPFKDREPPAERREEGLVDMTEMVDSMMTVRDKKSFFEEAQKVEGSRMYTRKDPIDIPERLGPDPDEDAAAMDFSNVDLPKVDLSKLVNRFESPQPKIYARKEPIVITERLGSDTEDAEADPPRADEVHSFNVKAIKNVFETGEHGSRAARELREIIERREPEIGHPQAAAHSETTVVSELFCSVDDSSAQQPGSSLPPGNPPSYADVVRGAAQTVDVSTEELLRSFQQSWAESQGVFQNLGFSVTEQRSSQVVTHQQATTVTENSSSRVRAVPGVSEEGVPDGVAVRRQPQLP